MRLTRLELSGFKSFADTTALHFDDGVTAIVGPNGCGKSNISDAVRWVLGEQRARLLRSQKMDELIFQGAAKRRPVNIAEISLVLDNSDDGLPIAYNEVVVTRRVSRNGQSEYLVNQAPVRLRDVQDLLKGSGLGNNAGVVIEAQMIDRLLSDRAEERRSLFEEAAGIGLYRDRKTTTERRLEKTKDDLQRLDDLIAEVHTQVRSLARQRGRAERHAKFTEERFAIVMTLARQALAAFDAEDSALRTRRSELGRQIPEERRALAELERKREEQLQSRATAEARRAEVERRLAETRVQAERLEGDLKLADERLENAAKRKARAEEEREIAQTQASQGQREREAAAAERAAASSARESVQTELDLRTASEQETREQLVSHRSAVRRTEEALQQLDETMRTLAAERTASEGELEELRSLLGEAEERERTAVQDLEASRARLRSAASDLERARHDEQDTTGVLERARHALAAAREQEAAVVVERRGCRERLAHLAARRDALQALERDREGLAPAARALLQAREQFEAGTILGPLSDFVTTSQSQAALAERILGDWLQAVLVEDDAAIDAVRDWHRATEPGPLVLLPISPVPEHPAAEARLLADMQIAEPALPWVRSLLADMQPLDDTGRAVRRINGAVYLPGGGAAGPLSRRAELDTLSRDLTALERQLAALSAAADAAARAHGDAEQHLAAASSRVDDSRTSLRERQGHHDDVLRHTQRVERELAEAQASVARLNQRIGDRSSRAADVMASLTSAEQDWARIASDLEQQRAALAELESAQDSARERRVHWQVEEAQVAAREQAAREREERAESAYSGARATIEQLQRELEQLEEDTKQLSKQRAEWADGLAEHRVGAQELDNAATECTAAVADADAAVLAADETLDRARHALEALNEQAHRLEIALTESAGRRRALVERVEAEWHQPLDQLIERAPEVEGDLELLQEEADRLAEAIEALGPVNPLAVEEHAEESKRLEFLQTQRTDLVEARASLLKALREIDATARAMFTESFEQIRENFHSVFGTLFQGGECDVRLTDESDPLGSDIDIYAAPRGKRIQRIHLLSSGERALVALSLLFSIYLTKPAPFCVLDEVDAPLDDANVIRFVRLLDEFKTDSQFIVITHNPRTMQVADAVYGVTMQEPGVSSIVGVRLGEVEQVAS